MDMDLVAGLAGGLGVGTIASQLLSLRSAKRGARGDVFDALVAVESVRWAAPDRTERDVASALRDLKSRALVADVPREAVNHYAVLAQAGYFSSAEAFDQGEDDPDMAGAIPAEFADLISDAARTLAQLLWRPRISRVTYRLSLRKQRSECVQVLEALEERSLGPDVQAAFARAQNLQF